MEIMLTVQQSRMQQSRMLRCNDMMRLLCPPIAMQVEQNDHMYQVMHHVTSSSLPIHLMHSHRTPPTHNRPQQRRMIHLRSNTPLKPPIPISIILSIIPFTQRSREGSQNLRHFCILFFVFEEAGKMEDVCAGEGYEGGFVCGKEKVSWWGGKRV